MTLITKPQGKVEPVFLAPQSLERASKRGRHGKAFWLVDPLLQEVMASLEEVSPKVSYKEAAHGGHEPQLLNVTWSGRADSNRRLPAPKAGALTRLRHVPITSGFRFSVFGITKPPQLTILAQFAIKLPGPPVYCSLSQDWRSVLKAARARARWLILFLISGPSWAMVAPYSGTQKTGS